MENEIKETKGTPVKIFTFNEAYVPPVYKFEKKGDYHFITWGNDNLYPVYLLELYNNYGSPLNKAIINKKSKLSAGFGIKQILNPVLARWAKKNRLEHLMRYISKDFEIYNGFCLEVIWNREGTMFDFNYLPVHTIRIGLKEDEADEDYYWYSKDWANIKKEENKPEYIKKYDPMKREGRQLLYYIEPNPAHSHLYPIANYSTAINYIDLDYQIGKFHINQVRQGFAPSFVLAFNTGIPTQDEQNAFFREFQRNYKGSDGSGKILITYAEGKEQSPELIPIQLNDSDTRFILLQEMVKEQITQAHECPVQLVSFTPGKLGSTEERKELLAEFNVYYISQRQEQLEYAINTVLYDIGIEEEIILQSYANMDETGLLTEEEQSPLAFAKVGERGGISGSDKAPKSDTPNKSPEGEGSAKGSASSQRGAEVTEEAEKTLQSKSDDFNKRYKDKLGYGVNLGMLKSVYQRGLGAYNVSHSPEVKSAGQWAQARVNAFLYMVKEGRPENSKYTGDFDLLPKGHPKSDKK